MPTQPEVAYVRTSAGQSACLSDVGLSRPSHRLLLLVNGYTPTAHLVERIALEQPHDALETLLAGGLIEPVAHAPGHR